MGQDDRALQTRLQALRDEEEELARRRDPALQEAERKRREAEYLATCTPEAVLGQRGIKLARDFLQMMSADGYPGIHTISHSPPQSTKPERRKVLRRRLVKAQGPSDIRVEGYDIGGLCYGEGSELSRNYDAYRFCLPESVHARAVSRGSRCYEFWASRGSVGRYSDKLILLCPDGHVRTGLGRPVGPALNPRIGTIRHWSVSADRIGAGDFSELIELPLEDVLAMHLQHSANVSW